MLYWIELRLHVYGQKLMCGCKLSCEMICLISECSWRIRR